MTVHRKRIVCSRVYGPRVGAVRLGHHEIRGLGLSFKRMRRGVIGLANPGTEPFVMIGIAMHSWR